MVLDTGPDFHAAAHIHAIRTDTANGFGDIS
jgi:hypothetical protein